MLVYLSCMLAACVILAELHAIRRITAGTKRMQAALAPPSNPAQPSDSDMPDA